MSWVDGALLATVQADADGGWSHTLAPDQALADGVHTVESTAVDAVENRSGTTSGTFTVDTAAGADTPAPDTRIDAAPTSPTTETDATFAFSATEANSTFECSLDGAPFAPCESGVTYTGLSEGSHTFQVRATNEAGNTDPTPASHAWEIFVDTDGDGLSDGDEIQEGTDPKNPDSDFDGVSDANELDQGTDPLDPDSDGNGLDDGAERLYGTDPLDSDSDDGGEGDGHEVGRGTDPLDPSDDEPPVEPVCGNGLVEEGETCDDGNEDDGDGCSRKCAREPGYTCDEKEPSSCTPDKEPGSELLVTGGGCVCDAQGGADVALPALALLLLGLRRRRQRS